MPASTVGDARALRKPCRACGRSLPLDAFTTEKAVCKACRAARARVERRIRPRGARFEREHYLRRKYGITFEQEQLLLDAQGRACAICGVGFSAPGSWCLDHDHVTGELRGALCFACNVVLGRIADSPFWLDAAAEYLRRPPAVGVLGEAAR